MTGYETALDWVPDSTYINSTQGINYVAWQVGRSERLQRALWLIAPVMDSPVDLDTLLPVDVVEVDILGEVNRYGHTPSVLSKDSINQLQVKFLAEVDAISQAVADGYR